jgi:hypothetical protein
MSARIDRELDEAAREPREEGSMMAYIFWHRPCDCRASALSSTSREPAAAGFPGVGIFSDIARAVDGAIRLATRIDASLKGPGRWPAQQHLCVWVDDDRARAAAAQMEEGMAASKASSGASPPERSRLVWLTRPRAIQWRPVLDALHRSVPAATC